MATVVVNLTPSDTHWTPPAGVTILDEVAVWAGGGGGGDDGNAGGGGGAGSMCVVATNVPIDPGGVDVVVGARGAPGNSGNGGTGGDSTYNYGVDPDGHAVITVPGQPGGLGNGTGATARTDGTVITTPATTYFGTNGSNGTGGGGEVGVAGGDAANSDGDAGSGSRNDGGIGDPNLGGSSTPGAGGAGVAAYTVDAAGDGLIRITYSTIDPPPPANGSTLDLHLNLKLKG